MVLPPPTLLFLLFDDDDDDDKQSNNFLDAVTSGKLCKSVTEYRTIKCNIPVNEKHICAGQMTNEGKEMQSVTSKRQSNKHGVILNLNSHEDQYPYC